MINKSSTKYEFIFYNYAINTEIYSKSCILWLVFVSLWKL